MSIIEKPSLFKITKTSLDGSEINSVNAREIYDYLEIKTPFSMWIRRAIEKYDFMENIDFTTHSFVIGKATQVDYIVTLNMAKELAMLENNPKGKETRKYLIYFEETAKEIITTQSQEIQLLQGMLNTISKMDSRVVQLEQTRKLENWQEKQLIDSKNFKVYELAKKHDLENDASMIRKLHSRVWKAVKRKFNVPRYNEVPSLKFDEANSFIRSLVLSDLV